MKPIAAGLGALVLLTAFTARAAPTCCSLYDVQPDLGLSVRGNQVGLDVEAGQFNFPDGMQGSLAAVAIRGEVALPWDLTLRLRVPFYALHTNYGRAYGLGDIGLAIKRVLFTSSGRGFELSAGLSAEAPTGNPHAHMGMGHLMLVPVVAAAGNIERVGLQVELAYIHTLPIGEHGRHGHRSLVSPHDTQELNSTVSAGVRVTDSLWVRAFVNGALSLNTNASPVGSRLAAGPGILYRYDDWAFQLSADLPLTANRANDWRSTLSGSFQF